MNYGCPCLAPSLSGAIEEARAKGRVIRTADAWIAATAAATGVPLMSNNRADFECLDSIQLISFARE